MKVKTWHIGCLVILIAAALYFLVGTREGLDNSTTCWEDVLDASSGKFVLGYYQADMALRGQPIFATLDEAKAACASDTSCNGVVGGLGEVAAPRQSRDAGAPPAPTIKYAKFSGDATISPVNVTPLPAPNTMMYYQKKPCAGSGTSLTPMPPGPTGPTGGSSMTPPSVPTPSTTPSTAAGTTYNLTCTAAPVSGMTGSVGMPATPAAWNVTQPPSGWNSKSGYTTTGF